MIWLQLWLSPGPYSRVYHDQIVPIRQSICFGACSLGAYRACVVVDGYSLSTKDLFPCPIRQCRAVRAAILSHCAAVTRKPAPAWCIFAGITKPPRNCIALSVCASADPPCRRQQGSVSTIGHNHIVPVLGGILFVAGGFCSVWSWPGYMNGF